MSRRILDETTKSTFASDDYLYMDGQTNGSSKITPDNLVRNTTVAQQLAQHIADAEDEVEQITADIEGIQTDINDVKADIGDLADLDTTDKSSLVGAINEARGSGGGGLTEGVKSALLNCFDHVTWDDDDPTGQSYIDALEDALYPPAELVSISAVYTQGGTVYDTDTLDSLKSDLVVTALYDDSTTETVTTYTLNGTLAEGTSTITVAYGGKTTTFSVTVTHEVISYVTDGLIARWDGVDNTSNGHDSSATAWEDLVGTYDIAVPSGSATWDDDGLVFTGTQARNVKSSSVWSELTDATIEMVFTPSETATMVVAAFDMGGSGARSKGVITYSDNTIGFVGQSGTTYANSESALTDIKQTACVYGRNGIIKALLNGTVLSLGSATHSLRHNVSYIMVGNSDSGTAYLFKGKIRAIRVYNRQLTDSELAQNLSVDTARFSL